MIVVLLLGKDAGTASSDPPRESESKRTIQGQRTGDRTQTIGRERESGSQGKR